MKHDLRTARRVASFAADFAGAAALLAMCVLGGAVCTALFALGLVSLVAGWGLDR